MNSSRLRNLGLVLVVLFAGWFAWRAGTGSTSSPSERVRELAADAANSALRSTASFAADAGGAAAAQSPTPAPTPHAATPTLTNRLQSIVSPAPAPAAAPPEIDHADPEVDYVIINGHRAHPRRLMAKVAPAATTNVDQRSVTLKKLDLAESPLDDVMPELRILNSTAPKLPPPANEAEARERGDALARKLKTLSASGQFLYVEPDYIRRAQATPNDRSFTDGTLWGLANNGTGGVRGADVGATAAWDITTGSPDVIVGVIDSGIRYTHRELAPNMWRNPREIAGNGLDDDGDGYIDNVFGINAINRSGDPFDDNGHGTHCSGTIGAAANDGNRHVGVAWRVRLMGLKFLNAQGSGYDSDAIRCINFAVGKGVRILSNSWGGSGASQSTRDAIANAAARGVLFLAAAGNESNNNDANPSYPASYAVNNIISVAALDRADRLADFSNYGARSVHLGGPGVSIFSTYNRSDTDYATLNGTSMATPHVSGVAALVLARFPSISLTEFRQRLIDSVIQVPALRGRCSTGGRVNAPRALAGGAANQLFVEVIATNTLFAGDRVPVFVRVTDPRNVTDATVIASAAGLLPVTFRNDGVAPDTAARDAVYSALLDVPTNRASLELTIRAEAPAHDKATNVVTLPIVTPVRNDRFADRLPLSGATATATGSNGSATKEPGEPNHAGITGGKSVWWEWTAPATGPVEISTAGSSFDTLLAVYTGTAVNTLTLVRADDDGGPGNTSLVSFQAAAGTRVHIAVDGYSGASGNIQLSIQQSGVAPTPSNDGFAARTAITGNNVTVNGNNTGGSFEVDEPMHAGLSGGRSVWWRWTAPANGAVTLRTDGSTFDTLLAVYTGAAVNALTRVASDNDSGEGGRSLVNFNVTSGTAYSIAVDGLNGAYGLIQLQLTFTPASAPPANDLFVNRRAVTGTNTVVTGANVNATKELGEPEHAGNSGGHSVWWTWTAPFAGRATIATTGSSFDTLLGVYTGTAVNALTLVAANDNDPAGGDASQVSFPTVANRVYQIAVDGVKASLGATNGDIRLSVMLAGTNGVLSNDLFANRATLTGDMPSSRGSNLGATKERGEPNHAGNAGGRSLWWTWTAPAAGRVTLSTEGSTFDTLLAVYTGASVSVLTLVAADDDGGAGNTSAAAFNVRNGAVYQIAVDGFGGAAGTVALALNFAPQAAASNDAFASAPLLEDPQVSLEGSNVGATKEVGEPAHAGNPGGASVWWNWKPTDSGPVVIRTVGAGFDTLLAVYVGDTVNALTLVAANDQAPGGTNGSSRVAFQAVGNTTYHIAVDGFGGAGGDVGLSIDQTVIIAPTGDFFANAQGIDGDRGSLRVDTTGATNEVGEPRHAGQPPAHSVWFRWTAPFGVLATFDTFGSDYDTVLAIYEGNQLSTLNFIGANDDASSATRDSRVTFRSTPSQTYVIAIDGFRGASGDAALNWSVTPARPVLTDFTPDAGPAGIVVSISGENLQGATAVQFNGVASPNFAVESDTEILAEVPPGAGTGLISVTTPGGTVMTDRPFTLREPPSNDAFARALEITTLQGTLVSTNVGASREAGEPLHAGTEGAASVWFRWVAPVSGRVNFNTVGSEFDTVLAVYTGSTFANLFEVGSDDDSGGRRTSSLTFVAEAGVTYLIAVAGFDEDDAGGFTLSWDLAGPAPEITSITPSSGSPGTELLIRGSNFSRVTQVIIGQSRARFAVSNSTLVWARVPASASNGVVELTTLSGTVTNGTDFTLLPAGNNDNFANARWIPPIVIADPPFIVTDNSSATHESGEPMHVGGGIASSLWYRFESPASGYWFFSTDGSDFDTVLAVYTGPNLRSLRLVAGNDDLRSGVDYSAVYFRVDPGTVYHVVVDGFRGARGQVELAWLPDVDAPLITEHPTNRNLVAGQTLTLHTEAVSANPLRYQWSRGGAAIPRATNATLTITNVQLAQAGTYVCRVTTVAGALSSLPATVTVREPVIFLTQPRNALIRNNTRAQLSATVRGTAPFRYQWYFENTAILNATNTTYVIPRFSTNNVGNYRIVVSNPVGSAASTNAFLTLAGTSVKGAAEVEARLELVSAGPHGTKLRLSGAPGTYALEFSSDLHTWKPLAEVTNRTGTLLWLDPERGPRRFYRARAL